MQRKDEAVDLYYSKTDDKENGHYTVRLKDNSIVTYTHRVRSGQRISRHPDKELQWSGRTSQFASDPIASEKRKSYTAIEALQVPEPKFTTAFCALK